MDHRGRAVSLTLIVLAGLIALSVLVMGVVLAFGEQGSGGVLLPVGLLSLVIVLCAGSVAAATGGATEDSSEEVVRGLQQVEREIRRMGEQSALSDDARRVLNRANERDLLCRAIEEDIRKHDWEAAEVLSNELSARFGYHRDAERFRLQIEMARADGLDAEVSEACREVDRLIVERRWDEAGKQAKALESRFAASPRARSMHERVVRARHQYKEELERRFLLTAQADKVDEAMDLLRELDAYLTEEEAEPFREVARGVIGKARENLGAAFKLAYQDRQWGIAAGLGEQIVEQFPNSRMAGEVQAVLGELRERAAVAD